MKETNLILKHLCACVCVYRATNSDAAAVVTLNSRSTTNGDFANIGQENCSPASCLYSHEPEPVPEKKIAASFSICLTLCFSPLLPSLLRTNRPLFSVSLFICLLSFLSSLHPPSFLAACMLVH